MKNATPFSRKFPLFGIGRNLLDYSGVSSKILQRYIHLFSDDRKYAHRKKAHRKNAHKKMPTGKNAHKEKCPQGKMPTMKNAFMYNSFKIVTGMSAIVLAILIIMHEKRTKDKKNNHLCIYIFIQKYSIERRGGSSK